MPCIPTRNTVVLVFLVGSTLCRAASSGESYPIVDTGQQRVYGDAGQLRTPPKPGEAFFGQDGHYAGLQPSYRDNGDGTVSDLHTGLMWQKTPDFRNRLTWAEALAYSKTLKLGGHTDWRLPTVKELYSLILFTGSIRTRPPTPYLDTRVFDFAYPDPSTGLREMDAQYWSSTAYVGLTMRGDKTAFGVNFADGRIKGYPAERGPRGEPFRRYARCVRGNPLYGVNRFVDNGDGTVSDEATGLVWTQRDNGKGVNWRDALAWAEALSLAGHDDWRLPNAKELQSIVDYTRAPDAQDPARRGPAIDPVFRLSDPEAWCWTSTTHGDDLRSAVYVAFGRGLSAWKDRQGNPVNAHGAGCQRSDPKAGNPADYAEGRGPQGDAVRILNHALAVRNVRPDAVKLVAPDTSPDPIQAAMDRMPFPPPPKRGFGPPGPPPRGFPGR